MDERKIKSMINSAMSKYFATHDEMYDLADIISVELLEKVQKPSISRNEDKLWECINEYRLDILSLGFYHGIHFAAELEGGVANE